MSNLEEKLRGVFNNLTKDQEIFLDELLGTDESEIENIVSILNSDKDLVNDLLYMKSSKLENLSFILRNDKYLVEDLIKMDEKKFKSLLLLSQI